MTKSVFWQTKTEQLPGIGTNEVGTFERSISQQNEKILATNEHIYYDPRNMRSGCAGGNAERNRRS